MGDIQARRAFVIDLGIAAPAGEAGHRVDLGFGKAG
jgi:hypothetical protein